MLSEQVEAQEEKIRDMDVSMDEYKHRLAEANDVLQEVNKQNINFFLWKKSIFSFTILYFKSPS